MIDPPTQSVARQPAGSMWQSSHRYTEAAATSNSSDYELQDQQNATPRPLPASIGPERTRWERWAGWIILSAIAAITAITFIGAVIMGDTTIGQYSANWLFTALMLVLLAGLSQAY